MERTLSDELPGAQESTSVRQRWNKHEDGIFHEYPSPPVAPWNWHVYQLFSIPTVLGYKNMVPPMVVWLAVHFTTDVKTIDSILLKHDEVPTRESKRVFKWHPLDGLPEDSLICYWPVGLETTLLVWTPISEIA